MRALKHVGRQSVKLNYVLHVCDVRGLPDSISSIAVCWERGGKMFTTRSVKVNGGGNERNANVDSKLRLTATLFRAAKKAAQYDAKPSTLRVLDRSPGGAGSVLGQGELDLATAATGNGEAHVRQVFLSMPGRAVGGQRQLTMQLSISSTLVQPDDEDTASYVDSADQV